MLSLIDYGGDNVAFLNLSEGTSSLIIIGLEDCFDLAEAILGSC